MVYKKAGYHNAKVIPIIQALDESRNRITFFIKEGTRARIQTINFEGLSVTSKSDLLGIMANREWVPWLSLLTDAGILRREELANDIERIKEVESSKKPNEVLLYDVNRGWTRQQALQVMSSVENLNVIIEQPCETLDDIEAISKKHSTTVSIDESLVTLQDAIRIAKDGIAEIFGIKLNRVGGLTKASRIRDVALSFGIDMFVMATGGSVLADTEALHLASTIPDANCRAVWACQDMLTTDVSPGFGSRNQNGHLHLPEQPGLGVQPSEDILGDPIKVYT